MALIVPGATECVLCGRIIGSQDDLVATSNFLGSDHPLSRYSDAAMHRGCFLSWEGRADFVEAFNSVVGPLVAGNGTRQQMLDDGSIQIDVVGPEPQVSTEQQLSEMERAREARAVARARADAHWRNRPRSCPRCSSRFVSVQDKSACPICRHVFHASESESV